MNKVIYISYMPISDRVKRDWYIDCLIGCGIEVEYWDVTSLLFGAKVDKKPEESFVTAFASYKHLEHRLNSQNNSAVRYIILISFEPQFARFYRLLTRFNCRTYFFEWGNFPIATQTTCLRILSRLSNPVRLIKAFRDRMFFNACLKSGLIKPFNTVFTAGEVLSTKYPAAQRKIAINIIDYDRYVESMRNTVRLIKNRYAVFLDINLPFHSDFKLLHMPYVTADRYFTSLNNYFDCIEKEHSVKIIICSHPQSNYDRGVFQGRTVIKGETPTLVRDSEFVISHHSTSISYAVLNLKPILFVYTDEMKDIYKNTITKWINDIAGYLDCSVINVDIPFNPGHLATQAINPDRYAQYKYHYLTSKESECYLTEEIFINEMNR